MRLQPMLRSNSPSCLFDRFRLVEEKGDLVSFDSGAERALLFSSLQS